MLQLLVLFLSLTTFSSLFHQPDIIQACTYATPNILNESTVWLTENEKILLDQIRSSLSQCIKKNNFQPFYQEIDQILRTQALQERLSLPRGQTCFITLANKLDLVLNNLLGLNCVIPWNMESFFETSTPLTKIIEHHPLLFFTLGFIHYALESEYLDLRSQDLAENNPNFNFVLIEALPEVLKIRYKFISLHLFNYTTEPTFSTCQLAVSFDPQSLTLSEHALLSLVKNIILNYPVFSLYQDQPQSHTQTIGRILALPVLKQNHYVEEMDHVGELCNNCVRTAQQLLQLENTCQDAFHTIILVARDLEKIWNQTKLQLINNSSTSNNFACAEEKLTRGLWLLSVSLDLVLLDNKTYTDLPKYCLKEFDTQGLNQFILAFVCLVDLNQTNLWPNGTLEKINNILFKLMLKIIAVHELRYSSLESYYCRSAEQIIHLLSFFLNIEVNTWQSHLLPYIIFFTQTNPDPIFIKEYQQSHTSETAINSKEKFKKFIQALINATSSSIETNTIKLLSRPTLVQMQEATPPLHGPKPRPIIAKKPKVPALSPAEQLTKQLALLNIVDVTAKKPLTNLKQKKQNSVFRPQAAKNDSILQSRTSCTSSTQTCKKKEETIMLSRPPKPNATFLNEKGFERVLTRKEKKEKKEQKRNESLQKEQEEQRLEKIAKQQEHTKQQEAKIVQLSFGVEQKKVQEQRITQTPPARLHLKRPGAPLPNPLTQMAKQPAEVTASTQTRHEVETQTESPTTLHSIEQISTLCFKNIAQTQTDLEAIEISSEVDSIELLALEQVSPFSASSLRANSNILSSPYPYNLEEELRKFYRKCDDFLQSIQKFIFDNVNHHYANRDDFRQHLEDQIELFIQNPIKEDPAHPRHFEQFILDYINPNGQHNPYQVHKLSLTSRINEIWARMKQKNYSCEQKVKIMLDIVLPNFNAALLSILQESALYAFSPTNETVARFNEKYQTLILMTDENDVYKWYKQIFSTQGIL